MYIPALEKSGECIFKEKFHVHHVLNDKNTYIKKTFKKMAQKVLDGVGLEVATHRATPPGDPGLRSFRNILRCQNVDIEIPSAENPPSLQIFKSNSSQV